VNVTFDLQSVVVDYGEWTLWASLVVSSIIGGSLGWTTGRRTGGLSAAWLRSTLAVLAAGLLWQGVAIIAAIIFGVLFMTVSGGAAACTVLVQRALFLPSVVGLATGAAGWHRGGVAPRRWVH
jgi:hypothetical protein